MTLKQILTAAFLLGIAVLVGSMLSDRRVPSDTPASHSVSNLSQSPVTAAVVRVDVVKDVPVAVLVPEKPVEVATLPINVESPIKPPKPAKQKAPAQDPVARLALGFVGADAEAEKYWIAAINDPGLPAEERKDLIEDLNEDGLSDPKHPGLQDLPLILNRIQLIKELAPAAMDQVNAKAFAEAYKDLMNMLEGKPVK
ncbi:MAG TPA: hypothetical protein VK968_12555 [Roseimicrobium sp.]|nr:hypothetical protein [Roseimicrobium sp.]